MRLFYFFCFILFFPFRFGKFKKKDFYGVIFAQKYTLSFAIEYTLVN